jgi:uracil-DNA glycosylase
MPTGKAALREIVAGLERAYPNATYALDWKTPWELLVGSILAAQSSDERVNKLTPGLFAKYKDVRAFARADAGTLAVEIRPCGLGPQKAKGIIECANAIVDRFAGEVPKTMAEMLTLPRVQRKTANVVLNTAHKAGEGIIVDRHVARVAPRLGLSREEDPEKIERDLMALVPEKDWHWFGAAAILLGRDICRPSEPRCHECPLEKVCAKQLGDVTPAADTSPRDRPAASAPVASKPVASAPAASKPVASAPVASAPAASAPVASKPVAKAPSGKGSGGKLSLPASWHERIGSELEKPYFRDLAGFLQGERKKHQVFPPEGEVFTAFELCPFDKVRVVLIGQDPYHDDDQAHGLCFSVKKGVKPPPSLVNMYKELKNDLGVPMATHGNLEAWARQGILMLNAVLTVRAHEPNSHKDKGWEKLTDAVIRALNERRDPAVFVLWGGYAQKKGSIVDGARHVVIKNAHPSPLSAKLFMGSKPFSAINKALAKLGKEPIDWSLP